jgi:hypothetical protein
MQPWLRSLPDQVARGTLFGILLFACVWQLLVP